MPLPEIESFNVEFVQLVQFYKCLYDITMAEYSSKEEQDKAWKQIAQKCDSTVSECKMRWKHLRGGLTRYLKKLKERADSSSKDIKQYYLWDVMQFVLPYLRPRDSVGGGVPLAYVDPGYYACKEEESQDTISNNDRHDNDDDNVYDTKSEPEDCHETIHFLAKEPASSSSKGARKRIHESPDDYDHDNFSVEKTPRRSENPDLHFFRSILPDMAELNPSQSRRFKLGVLQLLEDIFNEEDRTTMPSSSFSTRRT